MTPTEVIEFIFAHLRTLDWKDGWVSEADCYESLGAAFRNRGVAATIDRQNPFPDGSGYCDLVVPLSEPHGSFWLEVKGAWRAVARDPKWVNRNYRGHLLSLARGKHSALRDVTEKLPRITQPGDWVGELVIGFDRTTLPIPDADIARLTELGSLGHWTLEQEQWSYGLTAEYRVRVWLWSRSTSQIVAMQSVAAFPTATSGQPS